jgi:hypothetical protein
VPAISSFYGIVIRMFVKDHPPPHFHALYGEHRARVAIETGELLDGDLPPRAARLVREWARLHRRELEADWALAERMQALEPIEPLP